MMPKYKNPAPVVVGLVLTSESEVLVVQRKIKPCIGEWALPGGYVNFGEAWQDALAREIAEEANIKVSTRPEHMLPYDFRSVPDGSKILNFAVIKPEGIIKMRKFVPNQEVSAREFRTLDYYTRPEVCFPLHAAVLERYRKEHHSFETQHPGGW